MALPEPSPTPGYVCPFCHTDCSPIAGTPCDHLFVVDGENGWRFTEHSRGLYEVAQARSPVLFRDLLYHDPACRAHLRLLRANYDDSLEMFAFSDSLPETKAAFQNAIKSP